MRMKQHNRSRRLLTGLSHTITGHQIHSDEWWVGRATEFWHERQKKKFLHIGDFQRNAHQSKIKKRRRKNRKDFSQVD